MTRPDQLAPLIANATSTVRTAPVRPGAVEYQDADGNFVSGCPKCAGTGLWHGRGACFACKGKGKVKHKQPAEQRSRNRVSAKAAQARREAANVIEFKAVHGEMYAWLEARAERGFNIAVNVLADIAKYGDDIREGRLAAIQRMMDEDTARAHIRAERIEAAPVADTAGVDRLKAAFDHAARVAAEKGRRFSPRLTIGGMTISPAKATGANPGALYVKADSVYLGKVIGGKFLRARECDDAKEQTVLSFIANPADAARKYGQEFGICCICNAKLTNEESMTRGMGPICAENFGW